MLATFGKTIKVVFPYSSLSLKLDSKNKAAWLTLTNKQKRNPLSLSTLKQIELALRQVQAKSIPQKINILVLRGEGPVFSAGHDLLQLKETPRPEEIFNQCTKTMLCLKYLSLITLCAVDNAVTAAGLQLAMTCDLIVSTKKATFGIPGMKRVLFPSTPHVQLERSLKSRCLSRQISLIGEQMTASEAYKIGLVNKVVQNSSCLEQEIQEYILKAQKLSPQVIACGKSFLNKQIQAPTLQEAYKSAIKGMQQNLVQEKHLVRTQPAFDGNAHIFKK